MRFIATLLVALTFTGGPVAGGACALWCHGLFPSAASTCHSVSGEPDAATVGASSAACPPLLGAPFAVERDTAQPAPASAATDWFDAWVATSKDAPLRSGPSRFERMGARSAAPVVLRI